MQPRDEEQATNGLLLIRIGGQIKEVPTLKIKHSRKWKDQVATVFGKITDRLPTTAEKNEDVLRPLMNLASDVAIELVLAYDITTALGGKRWIEDNADDREVFEALQQMLTATFPLGSVLRSVVGASGDDLREMAVGYLKRKMSSRQGVYTNGRSDTGILIPMPSTTDSVTSSS